MNFRAYEISGMRIFGLINFRAYEFSGLSDPTPKKTILKFIFKLWIFSTIQR